MKSYIGPLVELARRHKPERILEIGLGYEGHSTQVWLKHSKAKVTTIDKGDWSGVARRLAKQYPERFEFILGRSEDVLPRLEESYDFIYVDGDHRYEGAKRDMQNILPLLADGGVVILDDCDVVVRDSAVDLDDLGHIVTGEFGVGQAADEVFKSWKRIDTDIELANGGRVYAA